MEITGEYSCPAKTGLQVPNGGVVVPALLRYAYLTKLEKEVEEEEEQVEVEVDEVLYCTVGRK